MYSTTENTHLSSMLTYIMVFQHLNQGGNMTCLFVWNHSWNRFYWLAERRFLKPQKPHMYFIWDDFQLCLQRGCLEDFQTSALVGAQNISRNPYVWYSEDIECFTWSSAHDGAVGTSWPLRSLQTQTILWFYVSMYYTFPLIQMLSRYVYANLLVFRSIFI